VTDQPQRPHPRPGARHPRRQLAARRALTILGALLLSLAAAAAVAPAASATLPPPEPPPPPPTVTAPGLPLWAVLVIVGGTITLSAATTLITLALHPAATWRRAPAPTRAQAGATHQPLPPARPAARDHTSPAISAKDTGFVMARHAPPVPGTGAGPPPDSPPAEPVAGPPDAEHRPSAARARGQLPPLSPHRRSS